MKVVIESIHKVSPRFDDVEGPFEARTEDFETLEAARKWLARHRIKIGRANWRREGNRVIFFPSSRMSSSPHAIVIRPGSRQRLVGRELQEMARRLRQKGYSRPDFYARKLWREGVRLKGRWTDEEGTAEGHRQEGGLARSGRRYVSGVEERLYGARGGPGSLEQTHGFRDPSRRRRDRDRDYPRVYLLKGAPWSGSRFKPGYYYVVSESTRGGSMLQDEDRASRPGELVYALGKTKRGGAVWFLAKNTRPVRSRK